MYTYRAIQYFSLQFFSICFMLLLVSHFENYNIEEK